MERLLRSGRSGPWPMYRSLACSSGCQWCFGSHWEFLGLWGLLLFLGLELWLDVWSPWCLLSNSWGWPGECRSSYGCWSHSWSRAPWSTRSSRHSGSCQSGRSGLCSINWGLSGLSWIFLLYKVNTEYFPEGKSGDLKGMVDREKSRECGRGRWEGKFTLVPALLGVESGVLFPSGRP